MKAMTNSPNRKYPTARLFCLGLILLFVANLSSAAEYLVVSANSVKVRQGPGTNHPGVTQLNLGHIVTKLAEKNGWTQIAFRNLQLPAGEQEGSGWMASRFLKSDLVSNTSRKKNRIKPAPKLAAPSNIQKPAPAKPSVASQVPAQAQLKAQAKPKPKLHQITGQGVKVRKGPGSQYTSFTQLYKGKQVMVLSEKAGWSHIKFTMANGEPKQGWSASRFLQAVKQTQSSSPAKPAAKIPKIKLSLGQENLICERGDNLTVSACTLKMSFSLSAAEHIKKVKVRCEAELLVGIKDGEPLKFPLKQEQVYRLAPVNGSNHTANNTANKNYQMEAKLETRGNYTVSSVDLISHRCAAIAFSKT